MPDSRPRNPELERDLLEHACRGYVDPIRLITHAQTRARSFPEYGDVGQVRVGVDWLREKRAELADAANYGCWWLEENPDDPDAHCVIEALRHVAIAYELLTP